MISIMVAGNDNGALRAALDSVLCKRKISAEILPHVDDDLSCDLLLCADVKALPARIKARALVAAEDAATSAAVRCGAETVVTCGLDSRCTLTPSSLLEGGGMATLQRETPTLSGGICLPQDLSLEDLDGPPEQRLMLAGALLLLE